MIESFSIDETLTLRINELCRWEGVTLYMALLSIFLVLLSRYTAKEDIPVGTPTAGRNDAPKRGQHDALDDSSSGSPAKR